MNLKKLLKAYSHRGTIRPDSSDKDGAPHPDLSKPYVKGTSKHGPAWFYKPEVARQHERKFMNNYKNFVSKMSPQGQKHMHVLGRSIADDKDRHAVPTGAPDGTQYLRLRHLNMAMEGRPGYSISEVPGGLNITAPRHSGNVDNVGETHTWHFDGKDLKFLGKAPISKSNGGKYERLSLGRADGRTEGTGTEQPNSERGHGGGRFSLENVRRFVERARSRGGFNCVVGQPLSKGARGDWEKEGYRLEHNAEPGFHTVTAYDKAGNVAGTYKFNQSAKYGTLKPSYAFTEPQHVRKGLASAAYNLVEKNVGIKLQPDDTQTDEAVALWNQPNRTEKFGKTRGEIKFPNLPKVGTRPDQNIASVNDNMQAKVFGKLFAAKNKLPTSVSKDIERVARKKEPSVIAANQAASQKINLNVPDHTFAIHGASIHVGREDQPMGFVTQEGLSPTRRIREHEGIHYLIQDIKNKYGFEVGDAAESGLVSLVHPQVQDMINRHLGRVGYNPESSKGETISHLYEILHDPDRRDFIRQTDPVFKENERDIMHNAKRSWKAILDFGKRFKP